MPSLLLGLRSGPGGAALASSLYHRGYRTITLRNTVRTLSQPNALYLRSGRRDLKGPSFGENAFLRTYAAKAAGEDSALKAKKKVTAAAVAQTDESFIDWLKQHGAQKGEEQTSAKTLPFQGRQEIKEKVWAINRLRYELRDQNAKELHPIITLMGQAGLGKSRLLQELPAVLVERAKSDSSSGFARALSKSMVPLTVSFGDGSLYVAKKEQSAAFGLVMRVLHSYFNPSERFSDWLTALEKSFTRKYLESLDLDKALAIIQKAQGGEGEVVFVLGVDEIHKVLDVGAEDGKGQKQLSSILEMIASTLVGPYSGRFVVPLLAGSMVQEVESLISQTTAHPSYPLPLPPLSTSDVKAIVQAQPWPEDFKKQGGLWRGLAEMGGLPGAIRYFIEHLESGSSAQPSTDWAASRHAAKTQLMNHIASGFVADSDVYETYKAILITALQSKPVRRDAFLGRMKVSRLEYLGALAYVPNPHSDIGHIVLPPVMLEAIATYLEEHPSSTGFSKTFFSMARRLFDYEPKAVSWQDFEVFVWRWRAIRLALLKLKNVEKITLAKLEKGAEWGPPLEGGFDPRTIELKLDAAGIGETIQLLAADQGGCGRFPETKESRGILVLSGVTYRNVSGAAMGDFFTAYEVPNSEDSLYPHQRVMVVYDCRFSSKASEKPLNDSEVKTELEKVKEMVGKLEPSQFRLGVFGVISPRLRGEKVTAWPPGTFVVTGENLEKYLGKVLTQRFLTATAGDT